MGRHFHFAKRRCTLWTMANPPRYLTWNAPFVAKTMKDNGIHALADLANSDIMSRSTVYRVFNDDWSGRATSAAIFSIASAFAVPAGRLVGEPSR